MLGLTFLDRTPLHLLSAGNSASARAHMVLVHGLGEHIGRYAALIQTLAQAGFAVTAYDQRGHGQSGGARGVLPHAEALLSDLAYIIDHVRERSSVQRLPLVLLGHSMGGAVVGRFVAEGVAAQPAAWYRPVQAMVVSSPAWAADLNPLQRLLMQVGRLMPDMVAANGLKPGWISHDQEVVRAYEADPLVHDRITPRLARFILEAGDKVLQAAPRWQTRSLVLWAGADRCVAPRGAASFAAAAPGTVVQSKCYDGLYHEIFNEPENGQVIADLLAWLELQFPTRSQTQPSSRTSP
jgi:alpha-beta hydrolase superfamily lysophospholipase